MERKEFSGKTLDEALEKAAGTLGTSKAYLQYEFVIDKDAGFFSKLFSRQVKIKAWVEKEFDALTEVSSKKPIKKDHHQKREHTQKKPEKFRQPSSSDEFELNQTQHKNRPQTQHHNQNQRPPQSSNQYQKNKQVPKQAMHSKSIWTEHDKFDDLHEGALTLLKDLVRRVSEIFSVKEIEFKRVQESVVTVIFHDDFLEDSFLNSTKMNESLVHLYKRLCYKRFDELYFGVNFEARSSDHEGKVVELARRLAEKVKASKRPYVLKARTSMERKIIHATLENDPDVATRSVGHGKERRLIIHLKDGPKNPKPRPKQTNKQSNKQTTTKQVKSPTIV